jgi:hypothetical protein
MACRARVEGAHVAILHVPVLSVSSVFLRHRMTIELIPNCIADMALLRRTQNRRSTSCSTSCETSWARSTPWIIAHAQCFVLMLSFLCSVNCLPQAWLLIASGQVVRAVQDLGLHVRSSHLSASSYVLHVRKALSRTRVYTAIEKETHREIWWGGYTLDRMLALTLGRPGAEDRSTIH